MNHKQTRVWDELPLEALLKEQSVVIVRMLQAQRLSDKQFYAAIFSDLTAAIIKRTLASCDSDLSTS